VYYEIVFRTLSSTLRLSDIDPSLLVRFIRENKLGSELLTAIDKHSIVNAKLSDIVPRYFPLQQKDKIKTAIRLLGLDPIDRHNSEWERTFGNDAKSTLALRHASVHGGQNIERIFNVVDQEGKFPQAAFVKNRIKAAIVLAVSLETQLARRYPHVRVLFAIIPPQ